ncbi:MAG: transketolase family protein [Solirubrobacteraceae bacterium]
MSAPVQAGRKPIRQQFADTMLEVGQDDPELVVLIGDISHFILQPFAEACPGRFYNVGILEPTIVSMAAGMSKVGMRPVVHTIAPFIVERSFEQIKLDFVYHQLGGNLVTVGGTFDYANLGCTHHSYGDFALMKTLPGAEITYPATAVEFDALFRQAYRSPNITLFRIPAHQHDLELEAADVIFGKAIKVTDGHNLTVVATGPQLRSAMEAHDTLAGHGWGAEILYVHTIRPLDEEAVRASVAKTRRVLVVEEQMRSGGLGDDILRATAGMPDVQYASLSIPDRFVTSYGTYADHCESVGLTPEGVVRQVISTFGSNEFSLRHR